MTDTNCPSCGSTSSKMHLRNVTDLLYGMKGSWDLRRCADCELIFLSPMIPADLIGQYYPNDYVAYAPGEEASARWITRLLKRMAILPYTVRYGSPGYFPLPFGQGRMLDIGCGAGGHVRQMSTLGWSCTGMDISEQAIAAARLQNPSARFLAGAIGDLDPGEKFDLISMHHVLEHMHHPKQVIERCFGRLNPGGRLAVNVPNIASFEARIFGRKWIGLDVPRHLLHFSESVLVHLLEDAGFEIETKRPGMFASSVAESLILCLPAKIRNKIIHARAGRIIYLMLVPVAAMSYLFGNRGTVEIIAVKTC